LLTKKHKDSTLSHGENPESLVVAGLESVPGCDRQTDGQTELR